MTVDVFDARQPSRNFSFAAEVFAREPLYAGAALCLAALIAPTLVAMALDGRTLAGVNVWLKPLRFEIALTVYLATLVGSLAGRHKASAPRAGIASTRRAWSSPLPRR
jgi:hypothetical protein